jgi:hypothetical protein
MSERQCGGCTLCCRLLPVRSLGKKANTRCVHQRTGKGCAVYPKLLSVAPECRFWNCGWLGGVEDTADLARPDRSHYVIDVMPDYIKASDDITGEITEVPVVQIWIDPKYPDAHKDPALRAWLDRNKLIALVRYSGEDAVVLFPPSRMANRQWMERGSFSDREPPHSFEDIHRVVTGGAP